MLNVNGKEIKWKHGDQLKVAQEVGITRHYLNNILRGQSCDAELASKIMIRSFALGHEIRVKDSRPTITLEVIS